MYTDVRSVIKLSKYIENLVISYRLLVWCNLMESDEKSQDSTLKHVFVYKYLRVFDLISNSCLTLIISLSMKNFTHMICENKYDT